LAQAGSKLAPEVRAFVKEDAPVIVLTHARVIDGAGAAPRADQTLVICEGRIICTDSDLEHGFEYRVDSLFFVRCAMTTAHIKMISTTWFGKMRNSRNITPPGGAPK
jgi:hypothetical protein